MKVCCYAKESTLLAMLVTIIPIIISLKHLCIIHCQHPNSLTSIVFCSVRCDAMFFASIYEMKSITHSVAIHSLEDGCL